MIASFAPRSCKATANNSSGTGKPGERRHLCHLGGWRHLPTPGLAVGQGRTPLLATSLPNPGTLRQCLWPYPPAVPTLRSTHQQVFARRLRLPRFLYFSIPFSLSQGVKFWIFDLPGAATRRNPKSKIQNWQSIPDPPILARPRVHKRASVTDGDFEGAAASIGETLIVA